MSFIDERDLEFLLYRWLRAEDLVLAPRYAEHSRETFDAAIALGERLARTSFAPHYKESDRHEPVLADGQVRALPAIRTALAAYRDAGLFGAGFDASLGGLQLPHLVQAAIQAHLMAANIATSAYPMLTCANARLICASGTPAQIARFAKPQIEGSWFGTMCLSEPQAGSSLSDIATRAVFEGDDALGPRYRVFGSKMWISGGDHDLSDNIVHLVLAKVPGADGRLQPGTRSIALFIVPKLLIDADGRPADRNDIAVAGLNHKMGYRGTTNCLLNFGEGTLYRPFGRAGAVGYRLGAEGEGLALMFHMMNEARIAVGLGAAALACRGYHHARAYARERLQGRPLGAERKDAAQAPRPIIEHPDVKRMLLTQKAYAEGAMALILYCARLVDEEATAADPRARASASLLLGLLTPVAKSWPSEFGPAANDLAIQVHGGYGYTRDFDVEQVYRDNRLNPIHEGTNGIQAVDLVARKIVRDRGAALAELGARLRATTERAGARPDLAEQVQALRESWDDVVATVDTLIAVGDVGRAVADASWFLSAFGHVVVAWLWLDQALAAGSPGVDETVRAGKQVACRLFYAAELPNARRQLAYVRSLNGLTASVPPELL